MYVVPEEIPDKVVDAYRQAFRLVEGQRYSEAKTILKQCIDSYPQFLVARKEYALVLRKLGELDAALAERQAIKNLAPSDAATRQEMIAILLELNRNAEALVEAVELRGQRPWNMSYRAFVKRLKRMGQTTHVAPIASGILGLIPLTVACRLPLIELLSKKRYEEALVLAERHISQDLTNEKGRRLIATLRRLVHHGQIFISYRSCNANAARAVAEMLLRNDFPVWFAEYQVLSLNYARFDAEVEKNLREALASCRTALVFTNDEWADSEYCRAEIRHICEHLDKIRIIQICVPEQDFRPVLDWPILRDVPTRTCTFSNPSEIQELFSWLLDQLRVEHKDRHTSVLPDELGGPVEIIDQYRGGAVAALRVGPFRHVKTPFWYYLSNPADLESMLLGCPSIAFDWTGDAPRGHCSLIIDARVNRWTDEPGSYNLDDADDRRLYHHLRNIAKGGYERHLNMLEGGLHLFRYLDRGQLAITFRTPLIFGYYFWKRIYVIIVQNKVDGTYGEVNLVFSCRFTKTTSGEFAFREFCAFLPLFDGIAGSLKYEGYKSKTVLLRVRICWACVGSACVFLFVLLMHRLLGVPTSTVYLVSASIVGAILGGVLNHRLMVVPQRRSS